MQEKRDTSKARTSFSFDPALLQTVRYAAWADRVTVTAYVERALRCYLEQNPPPEVVRRDS